MRFALLGADAESLALADAAAAAGHAIAWREPAAPPRRTFRGKRCFDEATADAVIVGAAGDADLRARQVQELVKQGRPLLAVHPVVPSVISYFEIDMARTESGAVLQHFNPLVESELVFATSPRGFATAIRELGAVEQITATRCLADRVARARAVALRPRRASCSPDSPAGSTASAPTPRRATPTRRTRRSACSSRARSQCPCVGPSSRRPGGRSCASRSSANAAARRWCSTPTTAAASSSCNRPKASPASAATGDPPPARALERFAAAVAANDGAASTWPAALDAMELADSIEISLRRGRMIDVHHRELTEQLAFKGVMSAVGCGVLVVLVPLVLVVGWIAGLLKMPLSDYWPHVLLAFLAAFLALQLLAQAASGEAVAAAAKRRGDAANESASDDSE